jgi:hypothetical protein
MKTQILETGHSSSRLKALILAGLSFLFTGFSLLVSTTAFFYPLEIETRESAVWLHVLTLMNGISLYDHSQVAFVAMHKGPFDSLFKLSIATLFPFFEPWQVIRFAVLLLPYIFFGIAWKVLPKRSSSSPWHVLYFGSVGYLMLLVSAKEFLLVGRSDATVALLYLLLVYLSLAFSPTQSPRIALHGCLCGMTGIAIILTNWRVAPCVLAILAFAVWQYWQVQCSAGRSVILDLLSYGTTCITLWGLQFLYLFDANWLLYYKHILGFHSPDSGWGISDSGRGSTLSFLVSLFNIYADPSRLKGGPLLLAGFVYALTPKPSAKSRNAWLLLGGAVFLANALPYYLNYNGGGAWYFIPFVIILWFFWLLHSAQMSDLKLVLLGFGLFVFLALNYRAVCLPTVHRLATMNQAAAFQTKVRSLQEQHSLLSEDTFLFRTTYKGDVIDSGDEVSAVYPTGYYGKTFTQTVKQYRDRLQREPPDYIVSGFTESLELRDFIEPQYVLSATGPANFTANGGESLRLFQRKREGRP